MGGIRSGKWSTVSSSVRGGEGGGVRSSVGSGKWSGERSGNSWSGNMSCWYIRDPLSSKSTFKNTLGSSSGMYVWYIWYPLTT